MAQSAHHLASDAANRPPAGPWTAAANGRPVVPVARPLSLSILALAAAALGVSLVLWAGAWIGASDIAPGTGLAAVASIVGVGLVVAAGFEFVFIYGAWTRRSWAWPLGITLGIVALVLTLLSAGRASSSAHLLTICSSRTETAPTSEPETARRPHQPRPPHPAATAVRATADRRSG
jgi:hypothetical protein